MTFLMVNTPIHREPQNHYDEVLPPIGLGYICTYLKDNGVQVELFDALALKVSLDQIICHIDSGNFDYVGLNVFSTNYQLVQEIITRVSRKVVFFVGGAFARSNAKDILGWETQNAVNVIIGEADIIVRDILFGIEKEKPLYEEGNKKIFKVDRSSVYFPSEISELRLDRSFFQNEPTINVKTLQKEANIITSRGCMYDCAFCSAAISLNQGSKIRTRTPASIKKEILQIKKLYPEVQSIRILDDLFLRNKHSMGDAIDIFSGLNLGWRAMAHIQSFNNVGDDMLIEMKQSGCSELSIGIESGNNEILHAINKCNDIQKIKGTVQRILKSGIGVKGYFIFGFPAETEEQFKDTYNLAKYLKELSVVYEASFRVSVFQFRPYHGTQLYYTLVNQGQNISNIQYNGNFGHKVVGEYDFGNGNFSNEKEETLNKYIIKTRELNDDTIFVPYDGKLDTFPKSGTFFVGLSHKLGKDGKILEAFSDTTPSGKLIDEIVSLCSDIPIYITNLVKGVPLDSHHKIRYPNIAEKESGRKILEEEIRKFNPKFVYLFGKQVSDFLLKKVPVKKITNDEYIYGDTTFLLVDHPSYMVVYKRTKLDEYITGIVNRISEI